MTDPLEELADAVWAAADAWYVARGTDGEDDANDNLAQALNDYHFERARQRIECRPVPEPATKPCATCDGMGDVAVEFGETPLDYTTAPCSACGGSGVATTEGDKQ